MDILFAAIPAFGHVFPLLPLVSACAAAGHDVRIATGDPFLERLPWPTVRAVPAGTELDGVTAEVRLRHPEAQGPELAAAMFADVTAELVAGELDPVLSARRPDLVVYEAMNVGAAMAADVHEVPAVGFSIGLATGAIVAMIDGAARRFRAGFWAAHDRVPPAGPGLMAAAVLDPVPPSLAPPGPPPTAPRLPIRSVAHRDPAGAVPAGLAGPRTRPAVYLTLGTVSFGAVEVIRRAVDQIASLDADLFVAVGPDGDPEALGPVPGNVHLERFVDQPGVLDRVDVAVHHGGTGTVLGAAAAGVPQLILPQGADQFLNAQLIERAGLGHALANDRQDGDAVARSVQALLDDGPERAAATRVRAEIAGMPAPADVVPDLVALAGG
ncbi:glycosyltransferase [Nakamurella sp.]|uniref:glycosyltransferase n=1 Tax=Nakamurella sp. TaxID=1869182 RepID=UPI003B3B5D07